MKKIFLFAIAGVLALSSCSEDFLDSENYTGANSGNFPTNVNDLNKETAALYGVMNQISTNPLTNPYFYNIILGDEVNGGGGDGDTESHALGHLMATTDDYYADTYKNIYVGIARASAILSTSEDVLGKLDATQKNQLLGEAHFMRALFYLWAVQTWGDVPAYWAVSAPDECPQQSAETVIMPRILWDFEQAYQLMTFGATTQGDGHATKVAAAGFLARAFMFYEGFYKNETNLMTAGSEAIGLGDPQNEEEKAWHISKTEVLANLEAAISSKQNSLISDFRELWQYTNAYTVAADAAKKDDFEKAAVAWQDSIDNKGPQGKATDDDMTKYKQNLSIAQVQLANLEKFLPSVTKADGSYCSWAGNGNKEEIFGIQYGNVASWNGTIGMGFTNQVELYCGLRCDDAANGEIDPTTGNLYHNGTLATYPFGQGWGQATINNNAYQQWPDNDIRKNATVANMENDVYHYSYTTSCTEDAGLYNKKLIAITSNTTANNDMTAGPYTWWDLVRTSDENYGACSNGNCMQGSHYSDAVLMRYSDLLLMAAELGSANGLDYINDVHTRAGLPALVSYNLDDIMTERRWEFFGEGLRFNDLRRWTGIANSGNEDCLAAKALEGQSGAKVNYQGRETTMHHAASSWKKRYAETKGFLPIPSSQINIINNPDLLKQNAGWGSDVSDWNMTNAPVY